MLRVLWSQCWYESDSDSETDSDSIESGSQPDSMDSDSMDSRAWRFTLQGNRFIVCIEDFSISYDHTPPELLVYSLIP